MDWDNARIFLAIYRAGTLRGAAARLGIDQATAGRRLAALEQSLGVCLFLRTPSGYAATPAGELALAAAEEMEQAADRLQRQLQGADTRLAGSVRVTTTDTLACLGVVAAIGRLHQAHPDIRIALSIAPDIWNLTRREADLAVRTARPDSPDLIARRLAQGELGLYAAPAYLAARGMPVPGTGLAGHDLAVYQRSGQPRRADTLCGEPAGKARIALEANSTMMLLEAARAGIGIAELPLQLAGSDPLLTRIWPGRAGHYEAWLVMHGDLNRSARVRAVADAIAAGFAARASGAAPLPSAMLK